jgi:anti-sigma factor RsiW
MRFRLRRTHGHDPLVCREFVELITDYLEGALPQDEHQRFEAHLDECDGCAEYLQGMRLIIDALHEVPEPPPDPATREVLIRAFADLRGSE